MQGRARNLFFILFLIGSITNGVFAQTDSIANKKAITDCEATLAVATGEFNAGRFFSLPSILKSCLEKGFTNEQKIRAYILLCQVYLINDSPEEAEASYLKLLQTNPEYIATPEIDPIDVVYLSKKFTTRPVFTPHLRFGANASVISKIHENSTDSKPTESNYYLKPGITLGGGLDWNMSDRISLGSEISFSTRKFSKSVRSIFDNDRSDNLISLFWLDLPLYLKFQDYKGAFRPYGYAGYAFHIKLAATAEQTYLNVTSPLPGDGQSTQSPTEGTAIGIGHKQYLLNQSLVLGGGIKYKIGKNYVFADLRFQVGLTNVTKSSKLFYDNGDRFDADILKYNAVNDSYRVNGLNLTLGYIFPVYNPREKGGWQPKGLLGKILYGKTNSIEQ